MKTDSSVVNHIFIAKEAITFGTLLSAIDAVNAALGVDTASPCLSYVGIKVPLNPKSKDIKRYKIISFNWDWDSKCGINWRTAFHYSAARQVIPKGHCVQLSFFSETTEKWTESEIKSIMATLFEINSKN